MTEPKFWMVWNPLRYAPTRKHETPLSANTEAERLARLNPGTKFYVLEAKEMRLVDAMQRVQLGQDKDCDGIPF